MIPEGIFKGVIVARTQDDPGPASGILYDVDINIPGGTVRATGIAPAFRWPDEIDTFPFRVGLEVWFGRQTQGWGWISPSLERPDFGECEDPEPATSPTVDAIIREVATDPTARSAIRFALEANS